MATTLLLAALLPLLRGAAVVPGPDPAERDALCNQDGCLVVYFQRKTFLDAWRACRDRGGDLATVKRAADAATIETLFGGADLRYARSRVRIWIGLLRQPRQCSPAQPLRGFSWTSGDQDTAYTNWRDEDEDEDEAGCSAPRCVSMAFDVRRPDDSFLWQDGACSVPADGFLCHYAYSAMCGSLGGGALYSTPFNLRSSLLSHAPPGSAAMAPCPGGGQRAALCVLREDGSAGWAPDGPLCPAPPPLPPLPPDDCGPDNGGCEHFCRAAGGRGLCECRDGYRLGEDGRSCLDVDECLQSPCGGRQHCLNTPGSFACQCDDGYRPEGGGACTDVDECASNPCEDACENTDGSYVCHCRLGFALRSEDQSRCEDVDECQIPGTCQQMCVNYEGGFECYCSEGYELLSDNFSCGRMDNRFAATTPFDWDPRDYDWTPQQGHTHWPSEGEGPLAWLTDPPPMLHSDVIWVTTVPQEEPPPTQETSKQSDLDHGDAGLETQRTQLKLLSTTAPSTRPPTISSSTGADWSEEEVEEEEEEEEEEVTTAPRLHVSTSTISGGAWNWWAGLTTSSQKPGPPEEDPMTTDPSRHGEELGKEELGGGRDHSTPLTTPHHAAAPTQHIPSQPAILDPAQEDREQNQNTTWLLVGLLVPISILLVVMVALAAVCCGRCSLQPRSKNTSDCYHWISGAHAPPAGLRTQV